jgi:TPR repeat protein
MARLAALLAPALVALAGCPGPRPPAPPATCPALAAAAPADDDADTTATARAACAAGDVNGCDDLAEHWAQRELGPAAPADADVLRAACDDRAIASACMGLAVMRKYGTATGVRDPDGAAPYFAKLLELGDLQGYRGKPPSPAGQAALAATEQACAGGRRRACAQLGWAAFSAVQQDKDPRTAFARWSQACELGLTSACRWAGHLAYRYPEVKDTAAARTLIARAAETPGGEDEMGELLTSSRNPGEARAHYLRGCQLGSRSACMHAGRLLVADTDAACAVAGREMLADACAAGEDEACAAAASPPPSR